MSVPTLHEKYQVPAVVGTIDLDRRINQGDEVNHENFEHAQGTAWALRGFLGEHSYCCSPYQLNSPSIL
jgi:hypothetical protein